MRRLNRRALILQASYGRVDTDLLFSTGVRAYRARLQTTDKETPASEAHHNHGQDSIQAFTYETCSLVDLSTFEHFLTKLPADIYRAKGLLQLAGGAFPHVFNFTCGRFDFHPLAPDLECRFPSQGVFIGKDIGAYQDEILRGFRACERPNDG